MKDRRERAGEDAGRAEVPGSLELELMGGHGKEQVCILHLAPVLLCHCFLYNTGVTVVPGGQGPGGKGRAAIG